MNKHLAKNLTAIIANYIDHHRKDRLIDFATCELLEKAFIDERFDGIEKFLNQQLKKCEGELVYSDPFKTERCKWRILDDEAAKKYGLSILAIGNDFNILTINLDNIPAGMDVKEFVRFLEQTGIAVNHGTM